MPEEPAAAVVRTCRRPQMAAAQHCPDFLNEKKKI